MPARASSLEVYTNGFKPCAVVHKSFCFAGQPAPVAGLFPDDALPCVCGAHGDLINALSLVAPPVSLG